MIELPNGHRSWFFSASGAMAYVDGWPWEQPLRWLGVYNPHHYIIITKTLTWTQRVGNLKLWKWWKCIRFLGHKSVVNAVGLTNPGFQAWVQKYYPRVRAKGYRVIVSVMAESVLQADALAYELNNLAGLVGVQLNVSCPNVDHPGEEMCKIIDRFISVSRHPVIVKLGYQDPIVDICKEFDGRVAAYELINAVPWNLVYPGRPSPLEKYGLVGAVSGPIISPYAIKALRIVRAAGVRAQIISGGGISSLAGIQRRYEAGADGFALGTTFLTNIWQVRQLLSWCPPPTEIDSI